MPTIWVLAVWLISILIGSVWGLLTIPSVNAALIGTWLNEHAPALQALSAALLVLLTLALVLLTLAYAVFTNKLRNATDTLATIAADQAKLLAAGQRAYISVEPLGIGMVVGGARVLGHVGIHNAGRLPAHNVRWFINMKASPDGVDKDFPIGALSGDVVAPPGVTMPRGTRRGMLVAELNAQSCSPVKVRWKKVPFSYTCGVWFAIKTGWARNAEHASAIATIGSCEVKGLSGTITSTQNTVGIMNMETARMKARC
jgi:hypothetical protein